MLCARRQKAKPHVGGAQRQAGRGSMNVAPDGVAFCEQFYQRNCTLRVLPVCTVARLVVPWYVAMTL